MEDILKPIVRGIRQIGWPYLLSASGVVGLAALAGWVSKKVDTWDPSIVAALAILAIILLAAIFKLGALDKEVNELKAAQEQSKRELKERQLQHETETRALKGKIKQLKINSPPRGLTDKPKASVGVIAFYDPNSRIRQAKKPGLQTEYVFLTVRNQSDTETLRDLMASSAVGQAIWSGSPGSTFDSVGALSKIDLGPKESRVLLVAEVYKAKNLWTKLFWPDPGESGLFLDYGEKGINYWSANGNQNFAASESNLGVRFLAKGLDQTKWLHIDEATKDIT